MAPKWPPLRGEFTTHGDALDLLSAWDDAGIVESRRTSHIVIRDPHRLVVIAEQA